MDGHEFEELHLEVPISEPGFLYIYVSNENEQNVTAYFDDLSTEHVLSAVSFAVDYYPFGLAQEGRKHERTKYRKSWQGEWTEDDEELGQVQFQLRMYSPILGRFLTVDPARQYPSGYVGMGNNPVMGIDPTGGWNPIHGSDGEFRGYDSEGVGGEIIVYDGDFYAGMDQQQILDNGGIWSSNYTGPEILFAPSIPKPVDLANDPLVMDQLVNWSIYINDNGGRAPNGDPITLGDIISQGTEDTRPALIKFFDFGSMTGTNSAKRTVGFGNGSKATITILDPNFLDNPNRNEVMQVYRDSEYIPNAILFQEWDGRSTIMSINFTDHVTYHNYAQRMGL